MYGLPPGASEAVRGCVSPPLARLAGCWALGSITCLGVPRIKVAVMLMLASKLKRDDGLKGSGA